MNAITINKFNIINQLGTLLLLLFPISLFLGNAAPDIVSSSIAILFVTRSSLAKDFSWMKNPIFLAFGIFWIYLVIRSAFAFDPQTALKASLPLIRFPIFSLAVATWLLTDKAKRNQLLTAIYVALLITSINTLKEFFTGADFFGHTINYEAYPRLTNFVGKLTPGICLSMIILPAIASLFNKASWWKYLTVILALIAIFVSGERTAFILTGAGIILIALVSKKLRRVFTMFIVICSLLITSIAYFSPKTFNRQFEQTATEIRHFSSTSYGIIYFSALESIHQNFWLGTGAKQFNAECRKNGMLGTRYNRYCEATSHPHNLYLEILSNAGAIGFILFLFFLYLLAKKIYLNRRLILSNGLAIGATVSIIIKLIPAPISSFYLAWSMAPFWLMIGIAMTCRKK